MEIIYLWGLYSKLYIALSLIVTLFINRILKKLYYAPLIINFISGGILILLAYTKQISPEDATFNMYVAYMPVVVTSIITNVIIFIKNLIRKGKNSDEAGD